MKVADHPHDRLQERTLIAPKELDALIARVRDMKLDPKKTYHYEWPDRGYAVIAPAREGHNKHVVKTVLAPRMKPPGEKVASALYGAFFSELEKLGKVSVNKLKSVLQGGAPLYHMVNPANVENFIASGGRAMTAGEAAARGLVRSVEGGSGTARRAVSGAVPGLELTHGGAGMATAPLVADWTPSSRARMLAQMGQEGPVGAYRTAELAVGQPGPSKNWSNISFTEGAPHRAYGDVGLLTSSNRVHGNLSDAHSMLTGAEVQASPIARRAEGGFASHIDLPSATGAMVYDPRKVDRATALRLKQEGALPLNARMRRKMKYIEREGGLSRDKIKSSDWLESGNTAASGPEFESAKKNATQHLKDLGIPTTFEEQDALDALRRLKNPSPPTPAAPAVKPTAPAASAVAPPVQPHPSTPSVAQAPEVPVAAPAQAPPPTAPVQSQPPQVAAPTQASPPPTPPTALQAEPNLAQPATARVVQQKQPSTAPRQMPAPVAPTVQAPPVQEKRLPGWALPAAAGAVGAAGIGLALRGRKPEQQ